MKKEAGFGFFMMMGCFVSIVILTYFREWGLEDFNFWGSQHRRIRKSLFLFFAVPTFILTALFMKIHKIGATVVVVVPLLFLMKEIMTGMFSPIYLLLLIPSAWGVAWLILMKDMKGKDD